MNTPQTPRVRVYGTSYCGYCRSAESLLNGRGIPFEYVDVTHDPEARSWVVEHADGRRTVPVVFIDGRAIGGYQELARLAARGGLDGLRAKPQAA
jgi:glutaredoxin 3